MLYEDTVAVGFDEFDDLYEAARNIAWHLGCLRGFLIHTDLFDCVCREEINKIYYRFGYYSRLGFELKHDDAMYTARNIECLVGCMLQELHKLYYLPPSTLEAVIKDKVVDILNSAVDPEVDMSGDFIEMARRFIDEDTRQTR